MPRCNLCLKNHALRHCQIFVGKSIDDRRAYLNKWKYCLNCLAQTHERPVCQSPNRCAICQAKHHSMLHRERPHDVTSSSFEEDAVSTSPLNRTFTIPPARLETTTVTSAVNTLHAVSLLASELPLLTPPEVNFIPPLIRVNLINRGNPMWVTFLLDPKSESSYLKRSVANIFPKFTPSLHVEDKDYGMFDVSPTYEPRRNYEPVARWKLELKEFEVVLPPAIEDPKVIDHFRSIVPQAHQYFATYRQVDGIMGHRTIATIMQQWVIEEENMPKAQRSIFVWIVSGKWQIAC